MARIEAIGYPAGTGWALALSVACGLAYPLLPLVDGSPAALLMKGLPVGFLAAAAWTEAGRKPGRDEVLLAAIMTAGTVGDVLLELWFTTGAAAFAIGHVLAIWLYLRNRRNPIGAARGVVAALLLAIGGLAPFVLLGPGAPGFVAMWGYGVLLTAMAAAAVTSRFPHRVGVGAVMFVASDMLIVLRGGGTVLGGPLLHGLAVWYLYYAAQLLIFTGVSLRLNGR